ncbi:ribose 5-phosphate isomerase [Rhizodiscina lignyota]|uniref:Ribose-5-phosphate isomerase n=1 Tax=Rhizodiscina lignyota TaxID=1504668 RepID=A0A9P4MA31_9PEZI|nr:ribose 5-phosphate isomerase [Rhizodiscina lignyota]
MAELPIEDAKQNAAKRAVEDHFDPSSSFVGIGSGTTIIYVVEAIKEKLKTVTNDTIRFVPTGYQSRQVIVKAGLMPIAFDELPEGVLLDMCFDGADEVDEDLNCVKGGGACLFQEKLVAERSKKFICVADYRKAQTHLLTSWPSVPIEVAPISIHVVLSALRALGSSNPRVRDGLLAKAGPLKTDQDFFIIDAPFPKLLTAAEAAAKQSDQGPGKGPGEDGRWEVEELSRRIKLITGVLEVGLFCGMDGITAMEKGISAGGQKPVAVYFGNRDGSVEVRKRK